MEEIKISWRQLSITCQKDWFSSICKSEMDTNLAFHSNHQLFSHFDQASWISKLTLYDEWLTATGESFRIIDADCPCSIVNHTTAFYVEASLSYDCDNLYFGSSSWELHVWIAGSPHRQNVVREECAQKQRDWRKYIFLDSILLSHAGSSRRSNSLGNKPIKIEICLRSSAG